MGVGVGVGTGLGGRGGDLGAGSGGPQGAGSGAGWSRGRSLLSTVRSSPSSLWPRVSSPGGPRHHDPEEQVEKIRWQHHFDQLHPQTGRRRARRGAGERASGLGWRPERGAGVRGPSACPSSAGAPAAPCPPCRCSPSLRVQASLHRPGKLVCASGRKSAGTWLSAGTLHWRRV